MSRWWNDLVALLGDVTPGGVPVLAILLFLLTGAVALLWFWWPAWVPTRWPRFSWRRSRRSGTPRRRGRRLRWPRLGRLRWGWRWPWRRRRPAPVIGAELPEDHLPDLPADVFTLNADELAAAGRYKEAVRERLRAIVRHLADRQVITPVPGWTVTELARVAGRQRPALAPPLRVASEVFSGIWYGLRPATEEDDRAMRGAAEQVRTILAAEAAEVQR